MDVIVKQHQMANVKAIPVSIINVNHHVLEPMHTVSITMGASVLQTTNVPLNSVQPTKHASLHALQCKMYHMTMDVSVKHQLIAFHNIVTLETQILVRLNKT